MPKFTQNFLVPPRASAPSVRKPVQNSQVESVSFPIREHNQTHISPRTPRGRSPEKDSVQRYLKDVAASQPLSSEEESELARRIKLGDLDARTKLVEANLRFVISVAREYQNQGVPLADLISAGNIGLITAAERFDETKGFKFISYAVWWIRQAVLQTLAEHSRVVRLPCNRLDLLRRISRFASDLQQETGLRPTDEEIAKELGISLYQVVEITASGQRVASLDAPFDGDDNTLMETMADSRQEPPDVLLMRNSLEEEIEVALGTLDAREAEVIRLYFGLGTGNDMTLEEIGVKFGITRERVRQIKEKALRKLRHPTRGKRLFEYADVQVPPSPPPPNNNLFRRISTCPTVRHHGGMTKARLEDLLRVSAYDAYDALRCWACQKGVERIRSHLVRLVWQWGCQEGFPMKDLHFQ